MMWHVSPVALGPTMRSTDLTVPVKGGLVLEGVEGEGHVLELEGHGRAASLHGLLGGGGHLEAEAVVGAVRLDHHARGAGGGLGRLGDDGGAREGGL
jgi:hypothetical protein